MNFHDRVCEIGTELNQEQRNDAWMKAHSQIFEKLHPCGAYHLWETGFEQGDASDDDVRADAGMFDLNVDTTDFGETLDAVIAHLNTTFVKLYASACGR